MELGDVYAFGYNGFQQIIQKINMRILVTPVKWDIFPPKHESCSSFTSLEAKGQRTRGCHAPENSPATFRGETGGNSLVRETPPAFAGHGHAHAHGVDEEHFGADSHSGSFSYKDTGQLQMKWNASICSSAGFIMGCLNGEMGKFIDLSIHLDDVTASPRKLCLYEDKFYCIGDQGDCFVRDFTGGNTATKVNKVFLECAPSSNEVLETVGKQAAMHEQGSKMGKRYEPLLEDLPTSVDGNLQEVSDSSMGKRTEEHPFAGFTNICSGDSYVLATTGPQNQPGKITRHEDGAYLFRPFLQPVDVQEITCGKEHALLLTDQGLVYSFGMGSRGQLGHGGIGREDEPKLVEAIASVPMVTVSAGGWHSACVSAIGDLYIWGWNESGQLGLPPYSDGTGLHGEQDDESQAACQVTFQMVPAILDLPGGVNVSKVSCGSRHTAAVTYDKRLYTWGWGKYGQLGHGDVQSSEAPKQVDFFIQNRLDVLAVTCGDWSTAVCTRPSPEPRPR